MKNKVFLVLLGIIIGYLFFTLFSKDSFSPEGYKGSIFYSGNNKKAHMILNRALSKNSQITWGTGNHTASPIPTGAVGPEKYTNRLSGVIQNTDIAKVTHKALEEGTNVILVIGDGLGFNHMTLPIFMNMADNKSVITYFEKIMNEGSTAVTLTNPARGLVTGSAAAGTAISTGTKTLIDIVGLDSTGGVLKNSVDVAKEHNYSTAIITDAGITDATPAAFYAHIYNRDLENKIAEQLVESDIDLIFGGGAGRFIPSDTYFKDYNYFNFEEKYLNEKSSREDSKNLLNKFIEKGYKFLSTEEELNKLNPSEEKVLGLFAPGGLEAPIDRYYKETKQPSIAAVSEKALKILSKRKNFFIMIEAARIDWEAHDNDAGAVYHAVEEMNKILEVCYNYYTNNKKNTLLIFTADHETGGFGISYTKVNKENQFTKKLSNGEEWFSITSPLHFSDFRKLKEQKKSIYKIFQNVNSSNELFNEVNNNLPYRISEEDAKVIYNVLKGYNKSK